MKDRPLILQETFPQTALIYFISQAPEFFEQLNETG